MRGRSPTALQWAAMRGISEGQPPVRELVAAAGGVAVRTLQKRAAGEKWESITFRGRRVADKFGEAVAFA